MAKTRIVVVDDESSLADLLAYNLEQAGYEVFVARDGIDGLNQVQLKTPELVILDLMLPGLDGLEVCRQLRADPATSDILILMLTAKTEETDQIVGFAVGADDYVAKPFSVKVLLERIRALLRRQEGATNDRSIVVSQGVMVDRRRHRVTAGEHVLELTPSEFSLLDALIRQPGRAFTRDELIDAALGDDAIVLERTIDVHVRALRQKMNEYAELVQTVRGVGYRFREPAVDASSRNDAGADRAG